MAFEYFNAMTGNSLDILDRHMQFTIKNHFIANYSLAERKCVKTVRVDINAGYETVIKELFPIAEIIIDGFHLVQLISRYMKTSIKTLKKHLSYILNSFSYPYSNGRIEGINNKIKVLNHVAYGYRNFSNYNKRILI